MTDFLLGKYGSCDVFSNARGIPPWKPTAYRAKNICFFWCYFHHTSDPSFFNYNKKKLGIAPKFFLKKFKLKFTKTNAPQSLYKGFESHMSKFECWLVPIFLHIFFILLLILPSKKTSKCMCKHIWQTKRSLRKFAIMNQISENVPLHENAKNITLKLEGIQPCLHISSVLKQNSSRPLFWGFTNAQQTWKWAQNTNLP